MSGAAVVIRQNRYLGAFRQAGATSPSAARTLNDLHVRPSWIFRRMAARGVFLNAGADRWYMSESAATAFIRRRRTIAVCLLAVAVVVFVVAMVLG